MAQRTDRERNIVSAVCTALESSHGTLVFDHHPDEHTDHNASAPKAPDWLLRGRSTQVMLEVTELARDVPLQFTRDRFRRAQEALSQIAWRGSWTLCFPTMKDREVVEAVRNGEIQDAVDKAGPAPCELRDEDYRLVLMKVSDHGSGFTAFGQDPVNTDPAHVEQTLRHYLDEAQEKFLYQRDDDGVLILDAASYVLGPILVCDALRRLGLANWPRVSDVAVVVDEPYSDPPPPSGEVFGAFRLFFAR